MITAIGVARIEANGSHCVPINEIQRPNEEPIAGSHGEVHWSQRDGITVRLELPIALGRAVQYVNRPRKPSQGGSGSLHAISFDPEWLGRTADGGQVRLFATNADTRTTFTTTNGTTSSCQIIAGSAAYAEVILRRRDALSFWHDTPQRERLFVLGFQISRWPEEEGVVFSLEGTQTRTSRQCISLSSDKSFSLYRAKCLPESIQGAWLTHGHKDGPAFWYPEPCDAVRVLISLLVGQWTPFLWRDSFLDDDQLSRLYFGWHRDVRPPVGSEQPVPLTRCVEALRYGQKIAARMPRLLEQIAATRPNYNIEWILSPLWTAASSFVDDQLALACEVDPKNWTVE